MSRMWHHFGLWGNRMSNRTLREIHNPMEGRKWGRDNQFSVMKIRDSRGEAGRASRLEPVCLIYAWLAGITCSGSLRLTANRGFKTRGPPAFSFCLLYPSFRFLTLSHSHLPPLIPPWFLPSPILLHVSLKYLTLIGRSQLSVIKLFIIKTV